MDLVRTGLQSQWGMKAITRKGESRTVGGVLYLRADILNDKSSEYGPDVSVCGTPATHER